MLKKAISLSICLALLGSSVIASAETTNSINNNESINLQDSQTPIGSTVVTGKTFTYENAPSKVKEEYEANCNAINKIPKANDEIFILARDFEKYGVNVQTRSVLDNYTLRYYNNGILTVSGSRNYSIDINTTYVGYGYTTSGDAVHCLQILLDVYAEDYSKPSVAVDGIFGPNTQNLLLTFQSAMGLSSDGIAGPNTWNTLVSVAFN